MASTIAGANLSLRGLASTGIVLGITIALGRVRPSCPLPYQQGYAGPAGAVDSYRIDTTADALLVVRVHAVGVSTRLSLVDSQGSVTRAERWNLSPATRTTRSIEHLPAGTYHIVVDSTGQAGSYTLTATWTPASSRVTGELTSEGIFGPQGMVVGDFNGDRIPDIATPGGVELGLGDGTFQSPSNGLPLPDLYDDSHGDRGRRLHQ